MTRVEQIVSPNWGIVPPAAGEDEITDENDTIAADWMRSGGGGGGDGDLVIAVVGKFKRETETLVNGIDLGGCESQCRDGRQRPLYLSH